MKRIPYIVCLVALLACAAFGFSRCATARAQARHAWLVERLPVLSGADRLPAEFDRRKEELAARVREDRDALAAFGEIARLCHANGFLSEACDGYQALMTLDPRNPRWPHCRAVIMAGFGRLEEAARLWRRTVELAPDYLPARVRLGDALAKSDQPEEAARVYLAAAGRDARNMYAVLGLARLDIEAGRWAQARERLERVASNTGYELGYDLLPTVYEELGQSRMARAIRGRAKASGAYRDMADPWVDAIIEDSYDTYQVLLAAGMAGRHGDAEAAGRLLRRALVLAPESAAAHFQAAVFQLRRRQYTAAREGFEKCVALDPAFADGWAQLAGLCWEIGDRAGAARAIDEGLRHCPDSPGLRLDRARRRAADGQHEGALADFHAATRLRPNEADAFMDLARLLLQLDREDEAVRALRHALRAEPGYPPALSALTFHAISSGNLAAARERMREVAAQPRIQPDEQGALAAAFRQKFGQSP